MVGLHCISPGEISGFQPKRIGKRRLSAGKHLAGLAHYGPLSMIKENFGGLRIDHSRAV
jgi:hypothetical protein